MPIFLISLSELCFPIGMKDGYVFQGDMVFTREEIRSAMSGGDADSVGNSVGSNTYGIMNSVRKK